jgi:hypothetical protein
MTNTTDSSDTVNENRLTLRLVWPQWQGAGVESVRELFSEVPFEEACRGYAVGAAVLNAVLPAHTGPTDRSRSGRVWRSWSQQEGRDRSEGGSGRATGQSIGGDRPLQPSANPHAWRRVLGERGAILLADRTLW